MLNKDTKIYASFSLNPGNNGCLFFNDKFQKNNINAIYKSFYSDNIQKSIEAVKILDIKGFAVSMPYKIKVLDYVDQIDYHAQMIGSSNTITNNGGYLTAYNTDWIGVKNYLSTFDIKEIFILGNGGFSKAVQYYCKSSEIPYNIITREDWDKVENLTGYVFNATPVDIKTKGILIDGRPNTTQGKVISRLQAEEQYKIYMNE